MSSRSVIRIALLSFSLLILAGSSIPGHQIPKAFELTPDKLIHCVEYLFLGLLIYKWLDLEFTISKTYYIFILTLLIGSTFGALDENYQRLTPGRTPDVWDWVLDTVGVLIAAIVGSLYWRK
jgi:VanZ family protein